MGFFLGGGGLAFGVFFRGFLGRGCTNYVYLSDFFNSIFYHKLENGEYLHPFLLSAPQHLNLFLSQTPYNFRFFSFVHI